MPKEQYLNPLLFALLERHFGKGQVRIRAQGQPIRWQETQERRIVKGKSETATKRKVLEQGEEYHVCCPFCSDTRFRLHINHCWGVQDKDTGSENLWLMHCWNEECQTDKDNQEKLRDRLTAFPSQLKGSAIKKASRFRTAVTASLPGPHWRLDELAVSDPRHPAVEYLRDDRGFDPIWLGKEFNVGYCPQSSYPLAQHRIIIPMTMRGQLVGWQARYIGEPRKKGPPKYFTMPNMQVGKMAYNFDEAIKHPTVALVEGPMDVWGTGPEAMGLLGKSLNLELRKMLIAGLRPDAVVVIMLDPNQDPREAAKGKPHHIEVAWRQLREALPPERLLRVYLPEDMDPGKLHQEFTHDFIRREAAKQGVTVNLTATQFAA